MTVKHLSVALLVAATQPAIAQQPSENIWTTPGGDLSILTPACNSPADTLCGVIVGVKSEELKPWKGQLCGEPLMWNLKPGRGENTWINGTVYDLESQKEYPVKIDFLKDAMRMTVGTGRSMTWVAASKTDLNCK
jgi:uncharacterized protein (DUF2147 family)